MSDRHEPTISALPSEPEEHTGSRPRSQQTPPPRRPAPSGKRSGSGGGGRGLAVVALFVALAGLAFAGYVYQQLQSAQDQLALSAGNLVLADGSIITCESGNRRLVRRTLDETVAPSHSMPSKKSVVESGCRTPRSRK